MQVIEPEDSIGRVNRGGIGGMVCVGGQEESKDLKSRMRRTLR